MRASEFVIEPGTMLMGKLAKTGQIVRIIKQVTGPAFAKDKSEVWSLIDTEPERHNKISSTKWVPADTAFEWVRPYLEKIDEISRDRLERYLDRANRQVDTRQERMARARQRLSTSYEIYHAETPNKVVDRFEADTPALAQKYYQDYIERYESDVDYDLRLRRGTGIDEGYARKLNFDEIYGKYLKVTDNNGDPNKEGFSLVTPLNGDSWNWRERPEFIPLVKKKLNQPGFLRPYKYKQIIDSMADKQFDPATHIARGNK